MTIVKRESEWFYWLCRNSLKLGLWLYNRFGVMGGEHVPMRGGCIIAANHTSFLDPPAVGCAVSGRPVSFMARDTLLHSRLLGFILSRVFVIPIARGKGDVGALRKSLEALKMGRCVGLFPEGTRSPDGQLQPAKDGIGFLLAKAGVPVVPAYVDGTYRAYPKGAKRIRPAKVRVFIGQPILPQELAQFGSGRDAYAKIGEFVMSRIAALKP